MVYWINRITSFLRTHYVEKSGRLLFASKVGCDPVKPAGRNGLNSSTKAGYEQF
ncbi:hypothetical protein SAMN05444358_104127 [Ruegeria halocynthiae]|uniref:Uncharacterized protein n=1 Tax=Ruegeria halocynthiae TaxID=985054 RepID=A0A1H3ACD2_9RHOB|nr:hypothetical protein SAMN05444358_104127 [Ruegeria halocynthiae]